MAAVVGAGAPAAPAAPAAAAGGAAGAGAAQTRSRLTLQAISALKAKFAKWHSELPIQASHTIVKLAPNPRDPAKHGTRRRELNALMAQYNLDGPQVSRQLLNWKKGMGLLNDENRLHTTLAEQYATGASWSASGGGVCGSSR